MKTFQIFSKIRKYERWISTHCPVTNCTCETIRWAFGRSSCLLYRWELFTNQSFCCEKFCLWSIEWWNFKKFCVASSRNQFPPVICFLPFGVWYLRYHIETIFYYARVLHNYIFYVLNGIDEIASVGIIYGCNAQRAESINGWYPCWCHPKVYSSVIQFRLLQTNHSHLHLRFTININENSTAVCRR